MTKKQLKNAKKRKRKKQPAQENPADFQDDLKTASEAQAESESTKPSSTAQESKSQAIIRKMRAKLDEEDSEWRQKFLFEERPRANSFHKFTGNYT